MPRRGDFRQNTGVYLTGPLLALRDRTREAGDSLGGELARLATRYDAVLLASLPDVPAAELAVFRRVIAAHERLPMALTRGNACAALVAEHVSPGQHADRQATHALVQRIRQMRPAQRMALIEATERWARRGDSTQDDALQSDLVARD